MKYLFDTNTIIYFLGNKVLPQVALVKIRDICSLQSNISIITKQELLSFRFENTLYQKAVSTFSSAANIFNINDPVAYETIKIRKSTKIKLPDCIIAATAIAHNFSLISAITKDFNSIDQLT